MDIQTSHLLLKLAELRETQRDQSEMLRRILAAVERKETPRGSLLASLKLTPLGGLIVRGAMMWAVGACIISYLARGGDPIALIEALLKLFG
jgi:hypothetical protein